MSLIVYLIIIALTGLVVGGLARLALPGPDPMSLGQTMLLGIAGSFIAGVLMYLITGGAYGAGITLSIVVSTVIMYFVRRSRGGGLTSPGRDIGRRRVR
jgi:uncharacterized membrane protein YeaQ/YmgE (transglycosylase-associated protein family)